MDESLITVTDNTVSIDVSIGDNNTSSNVNFRDSVSAVINVHDTDENAHENIIAEILENIDTINNIMINKVDKEADKCLSENDLTNNLKSNYDAAYDNNHIHNNKTALDLVSGTNTGDQDLSQLADTTLSNLALTTALGNLGFTGQSLNTNGYFKFPNGLIIQWGKYGAAIPNDGAVYIAFPIAFPNSIFGVWTNAIITASSGQLATSLCVKNDYTTSGCVLINDAYQANARGYFWFAIGY